MLYTPHTYMYIGDGKCNMGRYAKHYKAYGGEVGFIPRRPVPGRPSVDEPALDEPALDEPTWTNRHGRTGVGRNGAVP